MTLALRIFTEPQQGASYDTQLAVAQEAERLGYDAFFRSDHFLRMGGDPAGPEAQPGPSLAARYAAEFNLPFHAHDAFTIACGRVRAACEAIGRDPATMVFSAAQVLCCGQDEVEYRRRAEAIGRDPDELRDGGACGTPGEVTDVLRSYAAVGATRIYLQVLDLTDLDHLRLVAEEVMPEVS